jgi:hypothetical protein
MSALFGRYRTSAPNYEEELGCEQAEGTTSSKLSMTQENVKLKQTYFVGH